MLTLMMRARQIEKLAIDNSPILLTAIGVVGTIGTAVLTHKAASNVRDLEDELQQVATGKEHLQLVWKLYIPPVVAGSLTIAAIVGANHIGSKRAAALAAAYTISEKGWAEYKEKVQEHLGANKHQKLVDEIAQDRVTAYPPNEGNLVIIGNGETICLDTYSMRYFQSSIEDLKKAMNDTNYQINAHGYASLSDFYDRIGLAHTKTSDEMGWSSDKLLEISFTGAITEDSRPCVVMDFQTSPVREYHKFH